MDATYIIYTGIPTSTIPILRNQNLELILQNIDAAINAHNTAPDYSGYNLYCVKETDGVTHPTNTQNFAEGICKNLCDFHTAYNTFTGTTYPAAISTLTTAVTGLQLPAITFVPFSITNTDTVTQVFNKNFTGINTILTAINPSGGTWSTLSITPPTTITTGFNSLIAYIDGMDTTIAGKQTQIPTFNNTGNCLAGGATDSIYSTVGQLITLTCTLPTYDHSTITWGGVTPGTDLQTSIQTSVDSINYLMQFGVVDSFNGILTTVVGTTYQGYKVSMDPDYLQYYKVALTTDVAGDQDFLDHKIVGDETTIHATIVGNQIVISSLITNPDYKVKATASDTLPDYLINKLTAYQDPNWGVISNPSANPANPSANPANTQVSINTTIDPSILTPALLDYISNTPEIFTQFQQLVLQTNGGTCASPTSLSVVLNIGGLSFDLSWTPSGSATTQNAKYRQKGTSTWLLAPYFTPPNPLAAVDSATSFDFSGIIPTIINKVLQFAVDSICSGGGLGTSNMYEMIFFKKQTVTYVVNTGVISVDQNPMIGIDTIQYRLINSMSVIVQTVTTTGTVPNISFASVGADTYSVDMRYGTIVNGFTLYSDDASQFGSWFGGLVAVIVP